MSLGIGLSKEALKAGSRYTTLFISSFERATKKGINNYLGKVLSIYPPLTSLISKKRWLSMKRKAREDSSQSNHEVW